MLVAIVVDLVASSAEELGREQLGCSREERSGEVDSSRRGKPQLACRGLVGKLGPGRGLEASDMLWEGVVKNGSVAGGVNLGEDVNAPLSNSPSTTMFS